MHEFNPDAPLNEVSRIPFSSICYKKDFRLQCLQLLSLDRLFPLSQIAWLNIVVNDPDGQAVRRGLEDFISSRISAPLAQAITILDFSDLFPGQDRVGYYDQQAVKLALGPYLEEHCGFDFHLMLDAKNHFVSPSSLMDFFCDGKPVAPLQGISDYWRRYVNASFEALDATDLIPDQIIPSITPYILYADISRSVISHLEQRYERPLLKSLISSSGTEFLLYFAELVKSGCLERYHVPRSPAGTFFTSWPSAGSDIDRLFSRFEAGELKLLGLHKNRIPQLSVSDRARLIALWERDLLQGDDPSWFLWQDA